MRSSLLSVFTAIYGAITIEASTDFTSKQYDYVVVDRGTAVFVVVEYLSRNPAVSVLLLEAGGVGAWSTEINTPGLALQIPGQYFWNYSSEAEPDPGFKAFPRLTRPCPGRLICGQIYAVSSGFGVRARSVGEKDGCGRFRVEKYCARFHQYLDVRPYVECSASCE